MQYALMCGCGCWTTFDIVKTLPQSTQGPFAVVIPHLSSVHDSMSEIQPLWPPTDLTKWYYMMSVLSLTHPHTIFVVH